MPSVGAMAVASGEHAKETGKLKVYIAVIARYILMFSALGWFGTLVAGSTYKPYIWFPVVGITQVMMQWAASQKGFKATVKGMVEEPILAFFPPAYSFLGMHLRQSTSRPRSWFVANAVRAVILGVFLTAGASSVSASGAENHICRHRSVAPAPGVPSFVDGSYVNESDWQHCLAIAPAWSNICVFEAAFVCDFPPFVNQPALASSADTWHGVPATFQTLFIFSVLGMPVALNVIVLVFPCICCCSAAPLSAETRAAIKKRAEDIDEELHKHGRVQESFVGKTIFLDVFLNLTHYLLTGRSIFTYVTTGNPLFGCVLFGVVAFGYKRQSDIAGLADLVKEALKSYERGVQTDAYVHATMRRQAVEAVPSMLLQYYSMLYVMHRDVSFGTILSFSGSILLSIRGAVNLTYDMMDLGMDGMDEIEGDTLEEALLA